MHLRFIDVNGTQKQSVFLFSHALKLQVDYKNASPRVLGWVVAAFSFGQLLGSPFFGFWGDKRPAREPLIVALLIMVTFNILYAYCGAFKSGLASWIMLVARAMVGFAAGELSIVLHTVPRVYNRYS